MNMNILNEYIQINVGRKEKKEERERVNKCFRLKTQDERIRILN